FSLRTNIPLPTVEWWPHPYRLKYTRPAGGETKEGKMCTQILRQAGVAGGCRQYCLYTVLS
ncbi:uncharacterized protein PpBr36_06235, partial [Pyricularia pennisetigena]|uniref:uncharacterized protein n=1 Tax=Pyricularia pennisetigena TaxID=1578925 RepID=UPI001151E483